MLNYCRITILIFFSLILTLQPYDVEAKKSSVNITTMKLTLDNRTLSIKGLLKDGKRYISADKLSEIYKGKTHWYPVYGKIVMNIEGSKIELTVDRSDIYVDGHQYKLSSKIVFVNNNIWVPVELLQTKFWQQLTKTTVSFDQSSRELSVTTQFDIYEPRIYSTSNKTRCVLEIVKELSYNVILSTTNQIKFSIQNGKPENGTHSVQIDDPVLKEIKIEQQKSSALYTITFSNAKCLDPQFIKEDNLKRLVIDFVPNYLPSAAAAYVKNKSTSNLTVDNTKDNNETNPGVELPEKRAIKKVVIDPGHGGKDAGAVGQNGLMEKDVNLEFAKELSKVLTEQYKYTIILTRDSDTFIPLHERADIANREKADVFISVHCNASFSSKETGFEVYFLSETASDAAAEAVAKLENAVIQLEDAASAKKYEVDKILISLETNIYMNQSSEICGLIKREVEKSVSIIKTNGVKQANFHVLRGTRMPAILLETAYISNSGEEKKLSDRRLRNNIVDAWARGILTYEKRVLQNGTKQ